jgi:hypothetical protein
VRPVVAITSSSSSIIIVVVIIRGGADKALGQRMRYAEGGPSLPLVLQKNHDEVFFSAVSGPGVLVLQVLLVVQAMLVLSWLVIRAWRDPAACIRDPASASASLTMLPSWAGGAVRCGASRRDTSITADAAKGGSATPSGRPQPTVDGIGTNDGRWRCHWGCFWPRRSCPKYLTKELRVQPYCSIECCNKQK